MPYAHAGILPMLTIKATTGMHVLASDLIAAAEKAFVAEHGENTITEIGYSYRCQELRITCLPVFKDPDGEHPHGWRYYQDLSFKIRDALKPLRVCDAEDREQEERAKWWAAQDAKDAVKQQ